jgi:hypothetical protein
LAAARRGDFAAVRALAAGASVAGPPPSRAVAAEAVHLSNRLLALAGNRLEAIAERLTYLRAVAAAGESMGRRLDVRR